MRITGDAQRAAVDLDYRARSGSAEAGRYFVPSPRQERLRLIAVVASHVKEHEVIAPLCRPELEDHAAAIVERNGLEARLLEFVMILLHNEVWREVVASVPYKRRTLLLPPCLRASGKCRATFDEFGLLCEKCGKCVLGPLCEEAEKLGYAVLIAEGTSIVAELIERGMIDAVIGVSCMPSLERAFTSVSSSAVPGLAIPLLEDGCRDTRADMEWLHEVLRLHSGGDEKIGFNLRELHDEVRSWFTADKLRTALALSGTRTEEISVSWLAKAGKRWRPFLAASVYRALHNHATEPLPERVKCVAIAVECIHKASLIYDDIQDNDARRYGDSTLHEVHGVPVALTASLFLLGQGYRLLSECDADAEQRADMLTLATEGHCELCLGQGSELCWMRSPVLLSSEEVLSIFRLKTAPSFDVVFRLGAICGGASAEIHAVLRAYSEIVGVAYQIQDDLQDFQSGGDVDDIKSGRPSIVMALAYENAAAREKQTIASLWIHGNREIGADEIRKIIAATGAEEKTRRVLADHKRKALDSLRPLRNRDLKLLLHRIVAKVLKGT